MVLQIDGELRYAEDALITAEKATSIAVAHSSCSSMLYAQSKWT